MRSISKWLWCVLFMLVSFCVQAQHEVRITAISYLNEINAEYEYGLNKYLGINAFASYVFAWPFRDPLDPYKKFGYMGAELRIYPNPKTALDGFFLGLYGSYADGNLYTTIYSYNQNQQLIQEVWSFNKLAFGPTIGAKWMLGKHFNLGFIAGVGRYIHLSYQAPGNLAEAEFFGLDQNLYDFRFGVFVGYRF